MSPVPGRSKGQIAVIGNRIKEVRYPGQVPGETSNGGRYITFATLIMDQWYPSVGLGDGQTFFLPTDGYYTFYFEVNQPDYPLVGFGNGWSGTGEGNASIITNRYGQEAISPNWGPIGDDSQNHWCICGPIKRLMAAGDWVRFFTRGTATGVGVHDYDPKAIITRTRS